MDDAIRPSVIDRLADRGLSKATRASHEGGQSVHEAKAAVQLDLDWVLNTRRVAEPAPAAYAELQRSVYHYGIPDLTSLSADAPDLPARLRATLEEAIARFEPRLTRVRVTATDPPASAPRRVRFVIDAVLRLDPASEPVRFDTELDPGTGRFAIGRG